MSAPVVVIGGGPTGVSAATLLGRSGVEVLLLDRWAEVYPQPRAVHLDAEVMRILSRVGIAEEFAAVSRPCLGLRLQEADGRVLAVFERPPDLDRDGHPAANMFDQPVLEGLLRANLASVPQVQLRTRVEVTNVAQVDDEGVIVEFTDLDTGERESVRASYVLGCDGANSVVRRCIGASMLDLHFEQRWLVIDIDSDADLDQWDGVHQVCDSRRAATYMRVGQRRYRWEFQLLDDEEPATTLEGLWPLLTPWTSGVSPADLEVVRIATYTFKARIADRWRDRRVFLLGDAAHLTPPFVGQGLCAGLRDSANLAWKIAGVLHGDLRDSALDSYEIERRPHARAMITLAMFIGSAMTRGGRLGALARRSLLPLLDRLPGGAGNVIKSQTPRLTSSVLAPRRGPRGLVGTLCPNAVVDGEARLDALAGYGWALVTAEAGQSFDETLVVVNGQSQLGRWLSAAGVTSALVRPDGTVACTGTAAEVTRRLQLAG